MRSKQNAQFQNVLKHLAKPDTLRWNLASLCAVEYHRQRFASLAQPSGIAMTKNILLAFGLVLLLSGCGSTGPTPRVPSQPEEPFPVLNGYGNWIDLADYGRVWQPGVTSDWAPFVNGEWVWTDRGWMWESDEPFGWVVYHYGYWMQLGAAGWVWVPGYEWSPARVRWYADEENIGWSPLPPPRTSFPMAYEPGFENVWVFVPSNAFTSANVGRHRYSSPPPQSGRRPPGVEQGPDIRDIERRSKLSITPRKTIREDVRSGPRTVARVRVRNDDTIQPLPVQQQPLPAEQTAPAPLPTGARQSGGTRTPPPASPVLAPPSTPPPPKVQTPPAPPPPKVRTPLALPPPKVRTPLALPPPKVKTPPATRTAKDSVGSKTKKPVAPRTEERKEKEGK